jgi:Ca-activated chloride channel family protein
MNTIHWASIENMVWLPLFVLAATLVIFRAHSALRGFKQLARTHKHLLHGLGPKRSVTKALLMCLGIGAIFIAFLRPQWSKQEQSVMQEGRDLLVLLDISGSMRAQDLKPNRISFAKLKIRSLLQHLTCERVGLILFSGTAFLQCPMTADKAAFLMFLENVDPESISSGTTALDQALAKALETFKQAGERKHKLMLLLTDGEDFSMNLDGVKKQAAHEGVSLFALGVGTPEGAPIPKFDTYGKPQGHETDESGAIALSKLNEQTLQELTKALNGIYQRTAYGEDDIANIVTFVQSHEKERYENKTVSLYHDQYPWFLGAAWLLLALEWLL